MTNTWCRSHALLSASTDASPHVLSRYVHRHIGTFALPPPSGEGNGMGAALKAQIKIISIVALLLVPLL
ncbi:hypothetical protein [Stenotrophomonas humi]